MFEKKESVGLFRRGMAANIDMIASGIIRIVTAQLLGFFWFNEKLINFIAEFKEEFGTEIVKRNEQHVQFIAHNKIMFSFFIFCVIVFLVGSLYHAAFNASSWKATIGKRIMNMMLVKTDEQPLSFFEALKHYSLSLLPFIFVIYLVIYQEAHHITIYQAITQNYVNFILGLAVLAWIQIHMITKKKITVQDILCRTRMINGRAEGVFPKFSRNPLV